MFIETSPSRLPEKLKNGKYLQRKFPNCSLNVKAIINTKMMPTNDTALLINPCLAHTIMDMIMNKIIPMSNIFNVIPLLCFNYKLFLIFML